MHPIYLILAVIAIVLLVLFAIGDIHTGAITGAVTAFRST